jgi:Putative transposase
MELEAMEFMRRFLQHVLPTGFMKVRYYGFLSPNSSISLDEAKGMIEISYGFEVTAPTGEAKPKASFICGSCGNLVRYLFSLPPKRPIVSARSG